MLPVACVSAVSARLCLCGSSTTAASSWDSTISLAADSVLPLRVAPTLSTLHFTVIALPHRCRGGTFAWPSPGLYSFRVHRVRQFRESAESFRGALSRGRSAPLWLAEAVDFVALRLRFVPIHLSAGVLLPIVRGVLALFSQPRVSEPSVASSPSLSSLVLEVACGTRMQASEGERSRASTSGRLQTLREWRL